MAEGNKGKVRAEGELSVEARNWIHTNPATNIDANSRQYNDLASKAESLDRRRDSHFLDANPAKKEELNSQYKETLLKIVGNLDEAISQLREMKGNFLLYFGKEDKAFDNYVAKLEQTRDNTLTVLVGEKIRELETSYTKSLDLPMPKNQKTLDKWQDEYPQYRFKSVAKEMDGGEYVVVITARGPKIAEQFE